MDLAMDHRSDRYEQIFADTMDRGSHRNVLIFADTTMARGARGDELIFNENLFELRMIRRIVKRGYKLVVVLMLGGVRSVAAILDTDLRGYD